MSFKGNLEYSTFIFFLNIAHDKTKMIGRFTRQSRFPKRHLPILRLIISLDNLDKRTKHNHSPNLLKLVAQPEFCLGEGAELTHTHLPNIFFIC